MTKNTCSEVEEVKIDKQVNIKEQFITDSDFNEDFQNVFGLPKNIVESLKEIC